MIQLYFYTGKQCHLCDLAQALLDQIKLSYPLDITKVDVKSDSETFHLYGARIPVLKRWDNQAELGWPFNINEIQEFLD